MRGRCQILPLQQGQSLHLNLLLSAFDFAGMVARGDMLEYIPADFFNSIQHLKLCEARAPSFSRGARHWGTVEGQPPSPVPQDVLRASSSGNGWRA